MMALSVFEIEQNTPGKLLIGPRPESNSLADWVTLLKAGNVTEVLSLLHDEEISKFDLWREDQLVCDNGMNFQHFPIVDFGVPNLQALFDLTVGLAGHLKNGVGVMIHCAGGIGRAGLVSCGTLVALGNSPTRALETVSRARGKPVPETPAQRDMVTALGHLHTTTL